MTQVAVPIDLTSTYGASLNDWKTPPFANKIQGTVTAGDRTYSFGGRGLLIFFTLVGISRVGSNR